MSRWVTRILPEPCPVCGLTYHQFRTWETYQSVYDSLKGGDPDDRSTWKYKRRRAVLRAWYRLKQLRWDEHLHNCLLQRAAERKEQRRLRMMARGKIPRRDRKKRRRDVYWPIFRRLMEARIVELGDVPF